MERQERPAERPRPRASHRPVLDLEEGIVVSREVTCVRASAVQMRCEQAMRVQLRSAVRAHVAHPRLNNRVCQQYRQ